MLPLYFPRVQYVPRLSAEGAERMTLRELCSQAGVTCRASGKWIERPIFLSFDPKEEKIIAEGTYSYQPVHLISTQQDPVERARWALGALAYSTLFDGVARASIKFADWRKIST